MTSLVKSDDLVDAAKCLVNGGLVAIPTETVYGLGANIFNSDAVSGIFKAKGRPSDNPLIVHIWSIDQLDDLVLDIPDKVKVLMDKFWPGPISFIFKKSDLVSSVVSGGLDTVAIRMPEHPVALEFLKLANVPVAAPSANSSGRPSPTKASHVLFDLDGKIDYVVDGGKCDVGVESTVLDCTTYPFVVLRPGKIGVDDLSKYVKVTSTFKCGAEAKSPGMRYKHYTPDSDVYLVRGDLFKAEKQFSGKSVAYIGMRPFDCDMSYIAKDVEDFSRNVFSKFRKFDNAGADVILVDVISEEGLGLAIMNRLKKAGEFLD